MESKQPNHTQQEVLSGWKDIARHLGKGLRTVQRYERELGLPVRRPSGHRTGAVMAVKSELDAWVKSLPTDQEPFDANQRQHAYLTSELAKRLKERARLRAQMVALRKELKANIRMVHESIAKVRQQLNETRKLQDSMASVMRQHTKVYDLLAADLKHRKPN
jgi:septal ring factor EnvC (AmiA/AmiB activator)